MLCRTTGIRFRKGPSGGDYGLNAEIEGQRYAVRWACRQKLNEDGSLTLRQTVELGRKMKPVGFREGWSQEPKAITTKEKVH